MPPAQEQPPELRADAARNRAAVLGAARQLLDAGEDGLAMNVVARHAGVGVGTVYRHFPTRQALLETLAAGAFSRLVAAAHLAAAEPDAGTALARLLAAGLAAQLEDPLLAAVLGGPAPVCPQTLTLSSDFAGHVTDVLARARDAGCVPEHITADDLRRLLAGLVVAARAGGDVAAPAGGDLAAADRYLRVVLAGLAHADDAHPGWAARPRVKGPAGGC